MFFSNSILSKINSQPQKATELLFRNYSKKLLSYSKKTWQLNEDTSWELINETCFKVAKNYNQYQFSSEKQLNAFVFRVFINLLKNHFRSQPTREIAFSDFDLERNANSKPQNEVSPKSQKLIEVERQLEQLEGWQRDLLLLRSQGLTYKEISEYLGKSPKNLKVYYGRLIKQLKNNLNS